MDVISLSAVFVANWHAEYKMAGFEVPVAT
jgi:hypothetical protein